MSGNVRDIKLTHYQIVDYSIWRLFQRHPRSHNPPHVLCHGFIRDASVGPHDAARSTTAGRDNGGAGGGGSGMAFHGLRAIQDNPYVRRLRSQPWSELSSLVGSGSNAELLLVELFCDCGMFEMGGAGEGNGTNWLQISGQ